MTVANGQIANQTTFNNAFISKTSVVASNKATGIIGLDNTSNPDSGNQIFNTQRYQNEIADSDGTVGEGDVTRKVYSSNNIVANGDSRKIAIGKLDGAFTPLTGHTHNGLDSALVVAASPTQQGAVTTGTQSFAGMKTFTDDVVFQESISTEREDVASTATITALSSDKSFVKITGSTVTSIQGASAGPNGQRLVIHNGTSVNVTIEHEHAGATAVNRFSLPGATSITLTPLQSQEVIYDTGLSRWVVAGGSGSGSGSGSLYTPLVWREVDAPPVADTEGESAVFLYPVADVNYLYARAKVPEGYTVGDPIGMFINFHTPDGLGSTTFTTIVTLRRPGTDAFDSITNQESDTPAVVVNVTNRLQELFFDLSSNGLINGIAVSPGDTLRFRLTQAAMTGSSDVRVLADTSEATFS